jgi:hypothetical protein
MSHVRKTVRNMLTDDGQGIGSKPIGCAKINSKIEILATLVLKICAAIL